MRRTEIDQVKTFCFSFVISIHQLLLQISFMLRSLSSSSLKEVVTKYLMSQPAKEVTVYINSFSNFARQTPIVLLTSLKLMIEKLALNDCRLKSLCETGTPHGHLCSSQESSSLTRTLLPLPMTFLLFQTPSDPIFVHYLFISIKRFFEICGKQYFLKHLKRFLWMLILAQRIESTNSGRRGESSLRKEVGCPS